MSLSEITDFNLSKRSFSNNFDRTGKRLKGRYNDTEFGGLPFLCIIMICDTFQISGKHEVRIIPLNRDARKTIPFLDNCFRISEVMRSKPGAFFDGRFLIAALI